MYLSARICATAAAIVIALITPTAHADQFQGRVVGISDGDTIKVMRDGKAAKIRLAEIDCPEKAQAFGQKAKQAASDMAFKKTVTVQVESKDRYGRLVGRVILPDGRCLNEELVRLGLAWHYKQYSRSKKLADLEVEARKAGRGLWRDKDRIPPWSWRKGKRAGRRSEKKETLKLFATNGKQGEGAVSNIFDTTNQKEIEEALKDRKGSHVFHGNVKSKVFHAPGCKHYNCKNCTARFKTVEEAKKAGYRPHRKCVK